LIQEIFTEVIFLFHTIPSAENADKLTGTQDFSGDIVLKIPFFYNFVCLFRLNPIKASLL